MLAYSLLDHAAFSLGERREPQPPSYLVRSQHNGWPWRSPRQTERPNDRRCHATSALNKSRTRSIDRPLDIRHDSPDAETARQSEQTE